LAATLAAARPAALLYRELATLRIDAPIGIASVDDLAWRGARRDLLEPLCASLGDDDLVAQVTRWQE
jgi:hypothetical protein